MRIRWTRPALQDLDDIGTYVAAESPVAASRLVLELFDRTEQTLSTAPRAGRPGRVPSTRELVLADLPYIVAYRLTDTVEILAVIHAATEWPDKVG